MRATILALSASLAILAVSSAVVLADVSDAPTAAARHIMVLDRSDEALPAGLLDAAFLAVTRDKIAPYGTQFERLAASKSRAGTVSLCGFVNYRDGKGRYTGFQPFYWESGWQYAGLPQSDATSRAAESGCAVK